jgi:hypothetical protein
MQIENITRIVTVLGMLAFLTSAIVQVLKEQPIIRNVPTSLTALVVSEVVTIVALMAYCAQTVTILRWYYVFSAVVIGFLVYLIATGGWDKLTDIWKKTQYKKGNE